MKSFSRDAHAPGLRAWACGTLAAAVLFAWIPAALLPAADTDALLDALHSIQAPELLGYVSTLAADKFEGREAGSRGGRAAGEYLAKRLEELGVPGAGDNGGYYQAFGNGCRNLLAWIEGSDPELKKEVILVGAHYDHVGYGSRSTSRGPIGYVHHGADDNASGVAGVLEIVEAFVRMQTPPRRSLLVALWDSEERSLLGSRHFVRHASLPLGRIVLAVNLDMIGRMQNDRIMVYGSRTGIGLRRLVAENNLAHPLELDFDWELKANSDHFPFATHDVPVLLFHTGIHDDLHRPSDDVGRINGNGMELAARLVFRVAAALTDETKMPPFRQAWRRESPSDRQRLERTLPPLPPRLGVRWRSPATDGAVVLTGVEPGSAAARAGLLPGDQPVWFAGRPILDADHFRVEVLAAPSPVTVLVRRVEVPEPVEIHLQLDGSPSRLGISWSEDDAEPGTVMLTRVVPGSPAYGAHLRTGDRVYAVANQRFADGKAFIELVNSLPGPLPLTVERQGRILTVTLDVPPVAERTL